jgi:hypothetical protein
MKTTFKIILVVFTALALIANAYAQSPREELQQMVEQLQKTPDDNALREKIIKLAQTVKPAPALPEEALRYEGRARAAFQSARQESDYLEAAREYQAASLQAPWLAGYYTDLCTIYEKATVYAEAKRSCQWALMAESDAAAGTDLKRRIAGLDFLIEKFSKERLSARLDQPLRTDPPGLPAGNRWYCSAEYEANSSGPYIATGSYPVAGREEIWFVSDGTTAHTVFVMWVEAESLAAFDNKVGATFPNQQTANLNGYTPPLQVTNPFVRDFPMDRDNSAPRRFYSPGIFTHNAYEISADGQIVNAFRRKGTSPAEAREEMARWSCSRQ